MSSLADNLAAVHAAIAGAAGRAGRSAEDVQLIAVSKTHSPDEIHEALDAGQTIFGESRVQEARAKVPLLPARAQWHFIGHLQKNKIRHALPLFTLFHGVDSLELARDLNRISEEAGAFPKLLLEVNVAGEATKFGFPPDRLRAQFEEILQLERLQLQGLMTVAPYALEPEDSRKHFAALRVLRDQMQTEFGVPLPELSMGMSGDFPVAIEEGATQVRVGTAIFGSRRGKGWRPAESAGSLDD